LPGHDAGVGPESDAMRSNESISRQVRGALEKESRVNLHSHPVKVDVADDTVILEGDVENIAAKKLALELAAAVDGVRGVVDRLRIAVAARNGDGAMRDTLCALLLREPELLTCTLRAVAKGRIETLRDAAADGAGVIEVAIDDGVVTLEGTVISLSHKRVAGVLAWWTPGCRDVVNALAVEPPEEDNDAEVVDALRLVLEIDPLVHSEQITASCRNYVVTLEGCVRTEAERRQAELDAWALFAVDGVVNRIDVRA
jgi:osmotically-inducible protein OsmY